ncbi:MAG: hypothetical protein CMJ89_04635 [Planctomycetes bacterium]|nr:hypothetical protein [Planctomycetota bacterium]
MAPNSRIQRILVRIAVALAAFVLALVGVEWLLGAIDPFGAVAQGVNQRLYRSEIVAPDPTSLRLFRHKPDTHVQMRGHVFRSNSLGLRGPQIILPKPRDQRRALFLGDSVVLGWGVSDEDTFVAHCEPELEAATGLSWDTVNAGHLLHDSTQELGVLEEVGMPCDPDLVVHVFVENDIVSTREVRETRSEKPREMTPEARRFLERVGLLARIRPYFPNIHSNLQFLFIQSRPAGQQGSSEHAQAMGLSLEEGWERSKTALRGMRNLCTERGVRFVILDYQRGNRLSEALEAFCREEGIPYDSIAFDAEDRMQELAVSPADAHANELGHRILTANIMDSLKKLGLLDD